MNLACWASKFCRRCSLLCPSFARITSSLAKTSDSDRILQLENRSPSKLCIYIHVCVCACAGTPWSWAHERNSYIPGRIPVLPFMNIPEGVVGFIWISRVAKVAGGFRGNPDKLVSWIRAIQGRVVSQEIKVWFPSGWGLGVPPRVCSSSHVCVRVPKHKIHPWDKLQEYCLWMLNYFIERVLCTVVNQRVYLYWRSFSSIIDT